MGVSGITRCFPNCKNLLSEIKIEVIFDEPENNDINTMKYNLKEKEQKKDNNNKENDSFSEKIKNKGGQSPFYLFDKGKSNDKDNKIIKNKNNIINKEKFNFN